MVYRPDWDWQKKDWALVRRCTPRDLWYKYCLPINITEREETVKFTSAVELLYKVVLLNVSLDLISFFLLISQENYTSCINNYLLCQNRLNFLLVSLLIPFIVKSSNLFMFLWLETSNWNSLWKRVLISHSYDPLFGDLSITMGLVVGKEGNEV